MARVGTKESESTLTMNVLNRMQRAAGYFLREDDHNVFICNEDYGDKPLAILSLMTTSDVIREAVDDLMKGG